MRNRTLLNSLLASLVLAAGCSAQDGTIEQAPEVSEATLTVAEKQTLANNFYNKDNQVTVRITMDPAEWTKLRAEEPKGNTEPKSRCNQGVADYLGAKYDWHPTTSVTVESSKGVSPASFAYSKVKIKKKSWCGSYYYNMDKPSLHMDFNEDEKYSGKKVEEIIGTQHLMFNNSYEDDDYIRQCLGYKLLADAGVPAGRCNFTSIYVNNQNVGVYVNLEPIEKRYLQKNFTTDQGNLYEIEGDDFDPARLWQMIPEGLSTVKNQKDLVLANKNIAANDIASVVDINAFMKFWSMEILLKHWDGYTANQNNSYTYNDVVAVTEPNADNVNFKLIPSGTDEILLSSRPREIYQKSILAKKLLANPTYAAQLRRQIYTHLGTVFGPKQLDSNVIPYAKALETSANALLDKAGRPRIASGAVDAIITTLKKTRSEVNAVYQVKPPTTPTRMVGYNGDCVHRGKASVGTDAWDMDHKACGTSADFLFKFEEASSKPGHYRVAYAEPGAPFTYAMRADTSHTTSNGKYDVYYGRVGNSWDYWQYFALIPNDNGKVEIQSVETGQCLHLSHSLLTPDNVLETYQAPCDGNERSLLSFVP